MKKKKVTIIFLLCAVCAFSGQGYANTAREIQGHTLSVPVTDNTEMVKDAELLSLQEYVKHIMSSGEYGTMTRSFAVLKHVLENDTQGNMVVRLQPEIEKIKTMGERLLEVCRYNDVLKSPKRNDMLAHLVSAINGTLGNMLQVLYYFNKNDPEECQETLAYTVNIYDDFLALSSHILQPQTIPATINAEMDREIQEIYTDILQPYASDLVRLTKMNDTASGVSVEQGGEKEGQHTKKQLPMDSLQNNPLWSNALMQKIIGKAQWNQNKKAVPLVKKFLESSYTLSAEAEEMIQERKKEIDSLSPAECLKRVNTFIADMKTVDNIYELIRLTITGQEIEGHGGGVYQYIGDKGLAFVNLDYYDREGKRQIIVERFDAVYTLLRAINIISIHHDLEGMSLLSSA